MAERSSDFKEKIRGLSFSLRIAKRYLFSKKSHNTINIISGISASGVALGTLALICVLSVFNGFETLISSMYSTFDPNLKITLVRGNIFNASDSTFNEIRKLKSVAVFTDVIEENALLRFRGKQMPATVMGVDDNFSKLTEIDSLIYDGKFQLNDGAFQRSVPGIGVANVLGLGAHFVDPLYFYAPKRMSTINLLQPESSFNEVPTYVSGIFSVKQAEYDNQIVIVSIRLARDLFDYPKGYASAVELKTKPNVDIDKVQREVQHILGNKFKVKNRFEQKADFYKIMKIEKWITFLILSFILLIASFNIIGSLSMLIIDKKPDIETLKCLGAERKLIRIIFLLEGWMISLTGAIVGLVLGLLICIIQEKFGIIQLGPGYVIHAYPVVTKISDALLVFGTVLLMGFISALYPVRYINKKIIR